MILKQIIIIKECYIIEMQFIKDQEHLIENIHIIKRKRKETALIIHIAFLISLNQIFQIIIVILKIKYMIH